MSLQCVVPVPVEHSASHLFTPRPRKHFRIYRRTVSTDTCS